MTTTLINAAFGDIRLIATDMDGTLNQSGKFTPELLQALADLTAANIQVIVTTRRSPLFLVVSSRMPLLFMASMALSIRFVHT